jgi:hypothetical protein
MPINHSWLAALTFAGFLAATTAAGAADDAAQETGELEALRAEVQRLREARAEPCSVTDDHQPPPAGGVKGGTPKYLLKARWDRLETGMEKEEVRVLLGRPGTMTRSAAAKVEIWGYGDSQTNRYGVGTVYFDEDEEVSTWASPTFKTD